MADITLRDSQIDTSGSTQGCRKARERELRYLFFRVWSAYVPAFALFLIDQIRF